MGGATREVGSNGYSGVKVVAGAIATAAAIATILTYFYMQPNQSSVRDDTPRTVYVSPTSPPTSRKTTSKKATSNESGSALASDPGDPISGKAVIDMPVFSGPGFAYRVTDLISEGEVARIYCIAYGDENGMPGYETRIWDKIENGYVPHGFMDVGVADAPKRCSCSGTC